MPIGDVGRHALRTKYIAVPPMEVLLADHLLGNLPSHVAALLSRPSPEKPTDLDTRGHAEQCGFLRPFLAMATLHPYLRLQFAQLFGVNITAPAWYGDPFRESFEILRSLALHGRSQNWLELLAKMAKSKTSDPQQALPMPAAGQTPESLSNGAEAIRFELLFLHSTSPRMYRRIFKTKETSPDSWSRIFGLDAFPRSVADLKAQLKHVDPVKIDTTIEGLNRYGVQGDQLWRMAILFLSGAWKDFLLNHFLTWVAIESSTRDKSDRHRNLLYPLFGILINQLVLLHLSGFELAPSLRARL